MTELAWCPECDLTVPVDVDGRLMPHGKLVTDIFVGEIEVTTAFIWCEGSLSPISPVRIEDDCCN